MTIFVVPVVVVLCCLFIYTVSRRTNAPAPSEIFAPAGPNVSRVLIFTAAVGGGHVAAGRALRLDIEQAGHAVVMRDGLFDLSPPLDLLVRTIYAGQLAHRPQSVGMVFALTSRPAAAALIRALVGRCFGYHLARIVRDLDPDIVVSTYPLVTGALGFLRGRGCLAKPVVALIPDYGVHPMWVAPNADLHLVGSRQSARLVQQAGGRVSVAHLPVAPLFRTPVARHDARRLLGLPCDAFVALIVGGAWGAGDIEGMTRQVAASGAFTIVVTGQNQSLQARLTHAFANHANIEILGWTDDLRRLMAAANCVIQNAGGMTCLEAVETQLPIVFYAPIRGHGEYNAAIMEQAHVATWPRTGPALEALLRDAITGQTALPAPRHEAAPAAAGMVLALAQQACGETEPQLRTGVAPGIAG